MTSSGPGSPAESEAPPTTSPETPTREDGRPGPVFGVSPAALRWGLTAFVLASLGGFGVLFLVSHNLSGSLAGFRRFDPRWIVPALVVASLDWFGGGIRVWFLLRPLNIRVSYLTCVEISGVTAALAYLTPSGAGGGPAQLYGLIRNRVSVGRAAAVNMASVIVNLTFLSLAGLSAWFFGASSELEEVRLPVAHLSAARLFEWCALGFAAIGALTILFAVNPRPARAWIIRVFGSGRRVRTVLRWLHELHGSMVIYVRRGKLALLAAILSGTLHFGGRFVLGWVVLRGFGIHASFVNILLLHVMLQFLLYFMPTPGGSGIGEVLAPALMSPFLPGNLLVAYTAVWRFFLTYLTVGVGGTLLLRWIGRDGARLAQ